MTIVTSYGVPLADPHSMEWTEHPRIRNVFMKTLLTAEDNPRGNFNLVQVPVGTMVSRHLHTAQVETVYIVRGRASLVLGREGETEEVTIAAGQIAAIPIGLEHALINIGDEPVELLAVFTPPLS